MVKALWSLYLKQKRRGWRWAVFFASAYLIVVVWAIMIGIYFGLGINDVSGILKGHEWSVIKPLCLCIMVPDLLGSFIFIHGNGIMDDYLKTKPVSERDWTRFLFLANAIDFNNWYFVVMFLPAIVLLLPVHVALVTVLMLFLTCYINGIVVMQHRKAGGWEYRLGVWTIYFCYLTGAYVFSLWLMDVVVIVLLYHYMFHIHRYNESKVTMAHVRSISHFSYIWMQLLVLLRAKRVRAMFILGVFFSFYAYLPGTSDDGSGSLFYMYFAFCFSSLFFGSLGFGVEANFFHGLMSKPGSVKDLVRAKYLVMCMLTIVPVLLTIPSIFVRGYDVWIFVGAVIYACGFTTLFSLPTCLYGKRIDLFAGSFMNTQGANWTINLYTLSPLLPMAVFLLITFIWDDAPMVCGGVLAALGVAGFLCSKLWIKWIAHLFDKNKYKLLERYSQ